VNHIDDVQQLTLVFVNTLNLDIVEGIKGDVDAGVFFHPNLETSFILTLHGSKTFNKFGVRSVGRKSTQMVKRSNPLVDTTDGL
jgi:hypothetical protein